MTDRAPLSRPIARTAIAAVLIVIWITASTAAAGPCQRVAGTLTLEPVTGAACLSPVGLCAKGATGVT